ncbi:MAG TPA: adenylate/guanylate cyclase domain-containing protein [Thermoleophilaceae bacterium]|nr:adenylate/guanylate cyclase domain-containing protein [Thermoleophilaceae bacterium]
MHTFLFADLVGFTTLSIDEGDERAAEVATRFHREVRARAARHGAVVVKSLGDGAMVRAGDACDALRLGLELAGDLDGLPAVRVGINTGPAVERDGDYFGSAVNMAARLSQAARGGEVLLSETTRAAARRRRPRLEPRGPRTFRNAREPVDVYAASERPPLRERFRAAAERHGCPYASAKATTA